MVQIQIVSDLHLEASFEYDIYQLDPTAPYLALLGDIGNTQDSALFRFLERILKQYEIVFYVAGNHEPYHSSWNSTHALLTAFGQMVNNKLAGAGSGRFIYLNQRRFDLTNDVTILGCVLFSAIDPNQSSNVSATLNDFYHTEDWSVANHCAAHQSDLAWLKTQVLRIGSLEPHRKIVILTHYCPTFAAQNPIYRDSNFISAYVTEVSREDFYRLEQVKVWAFGHTHFNFDGVEGGTGKRLVSNQRGSFSSQAGGFDPGKVIDV
ncbi:hypothetical protein TWF718_011081 [Orbilia javanica]|uniref:Calcineurin-like phosphoesterase domain-containing protein n=1 Tax=Orbilia javanica TaxID=47235 RepID=A0AAN8MPI5_9PEZI